MPEMTARDVIAIVELCNARGILAHIDGGWGVDALLGRQTRTHTDLDIAVQHKDVPQLRALLAERGFRDVPRDDTYDYNFVLGDAHGHQIDVHSYTFDAAGNCIFGIPYPFDSLTGTGSINGHTVKCIAPNWMVKFHTGYQFDEDDFQDVKALCEHFGIALPSEYEEYEKRCATKKK